MNTVAVVMNGIFWFLAIQHIASGGSSKHLLRQHSLSGAIADDYIKRLEGTSDVPKETPDIFFPDVEYPTNVFDTAKPFFFDNSAQKTNPVIGDTDFQTVKNHLSTTSSYNSTLEKLFKKATDYIKKSKDEDSKVKSYLNRQMKDSHLTNKYKDKNLPNKANKVNFKTPTGKVASTSNAHKCLDELVILSDLLTKTIKVTDSLTCQGENNAVGVENSNHTGECKNLTEISIFEFIDDAITTVEHILNNTMYNFDDLTQDFFTIYVTEEETIQLIEIVNNLQKILELAQCLDANVTLTITDDCQTGDSAEHCSFEMFDEYLDLEENNKDLLVNATVTP